MKKKTEYELYKELMAKPIDELRDMYDKHQIASTISYSERKNATHLETIINSYAGSTVAKYGIILLCVSMVCKTARRCSHIMKK